MSRLIFSLLLLGSTVLPASAETVNVAVAANFTSVAEHLAELFAAQTGHEAKLSFGATGQLYAQISQAAPFGVFLAADTERPEKAIAEGLAVEGSFFVYAEGHWRFTGRGGISRMARRPSKRNSTSWPSPTPRPRPMAGLRRDADGPGALGGAQPKLVQGGNISQTLQFVESGNAELGFVAASQILASRTSGWCRPNSMAPFPRVRCCSRPARPIRRPLPSSIFFAPMRPCP